MFMLTVNAVDPVWIGYGGQGSFRVYANAAPPTSFDITTGKGVKWITPLPSWGHGQPVAVAGKVFVIVEPRPDQIFPSLLCLDKATCKVLWERPLDHLKAAGAESARKELEAWFTRQAELLKQQYGQARPSPDKSHHDQMRVLNTKMGFQYDIWRVMSPYTWWCFTLSCIGDAFGTPVSDGKRIYACTTWGGYFAFDLDGKPLWMTYALKKILHAGGGETGTQRGRSPILHNGLLISHVLNVLRVFDATSGKLLWSYDLGKGWESMATPQVLTIGGKDVLITAGIAAFLLPEGKQLKVTGLASPGMQILVKYDEPDIAFFYGSGEHCGWINKGNTDINHRRHSGFHYQMTH